MGKKKGVKDWIKEYEKISRKEHNLKLRKASLAEKILDHWQKKEIKNYKSENGTLSMGVRKTWKYPEEIIIEEKQIKQKKKEAQQNGTAECKHTSYLTYKIVK